MTRDEWLAGFAEKLGVDLPDPDTIDGLLELAGAAAHASERTAAPIACYLAGRAGVTIEAACLAAESVTPTA